LYCHEEKAKQFTTISDCFKLLFKLQLRNNNNKKSKVMCEVLWMHQTNYFGLSVFFNYLCTFSPSLARIIGSLIRFIYNKNKICMMTGTNAFEE
jgi:hypothetical protein